MCRWRSRTLNLQKGGAQVPIFYYEEVKEELPGLSYPVSFQYIHFCPELLGSACFNKLEIVHYDGKRGWVILWHGVSVGYQLPEKKENFPLSDISHCPFCGEDLHREVPTQKSVKESVEPPPRK